ncbi:MAG TPA: hypothetical protein VHZ33_28310 [Trebonia sp.]|jgi:hypothetical protein|nr:hypothetical protein [Trebonia sp.]
MRKLTVRVGGVVVAASAALMLAGGGTAFASAGAAGAAAKTMTGPEVVAGSVHGAAAIANVTHIPLTLTGVVASTDRGFTLGPGGGTEHTLATANGKLTVRQVGKVANTQVVNTRTCHLSYTSDARFTFVPGKSTGTFAGATGPGAYQISFGAYLPRFTSGKHKGQCDTADNAVPLAKGAVASFLAAGVITVS